MDSNFTLIYIDGLKKLKHEILMIEINNNEISDENQFGEAFINGMKNQENYCLAQIVERRYEFALWKNVYLQFYFRQSMLFIRKNFGQTLEAVLKVLWKQTHVWHLRTIFKILKP